MDAIYGAILCCLCLIGFWTVFYVLSKMTKDLLKEAKVRRLNEDAKRLETRYCKDCRFYRNEPSFNDLLYAKGPHHRCLRPLGTIDAVSGKPDTTYSACQIQRLPGNSRNCGPEGKFFQLKK